MIRKAYITCLFCTALALAGVGVASLWHDFDWAGLVTERHWGRVAVDDGNLLLVHAQRAAAAQPRTSYGKRPYRGALGTLSFRAGHNGQWQWVGLTVPLWLVIGLLFVHPGVAFVRGPFLRRWRRKRNQCPGCGYHLSGNLSGRRPECGRAVDNTWATDGCTEYTPRG